MREVRINDTLSGEMVTLDPGREVGIYACGPTVYSRIHIGNARPFVVFSLFARFLRSQGYDAKLVINVTDINDKIYTAAGEAGQGSAEFAEQMTAAYIADTDGLGIGRPDAEPLASEMVDGIISLVAELVDSGHAYESGGDVYYRVASFPEYGKLSNRRIEDMDQGEEADSRGLKEAGTDFALWKSTKDGEDTSWDSPWGPGRPAWHIECSVMAEAELGPAFAIHGGGSDLIFPHHENEIAQSRGAGRPFAHAWMHNGMIETSAEKMSKTEGNVFQLSEAIGRYGREAVVAYLISGRYRQPVAFSDEVLEESKARVERLRNFLREPDPPEGDAAVAAEHHERFLAALADDFNTPAALAACFDLVSAANRAHLPGARETLRAMLGVLGLESVGVSDDGPDPVAQGLLEERERARAVKDFERADRLRDELAALGWTVRDSGDGARLVRG